MLIRIRVAAGAKNERILRSGVHYTISVREKAEGGMANARALQILARELDIPVKKLRIMRGRHAPSKVIEVL